MTLRAMEVFIKVAETGKMSTAAKQLYISQSSVSQTIAEIEKEYHVLLFERVKKQLFLTPVGAQLLEYARQALAHQSSIEDWLRQCADSKYIKVGATITVGSSVMSELVGELQKKYPQLSPFVYVDNTQKIEEKLLDNSIDLALVEGDIKNSGIGKKTAMDDYLVLICGKNHRFFERETVSPEELSGENFILREHGSGTRAQIEELLRDAGVSYQVTWECRNAESIKRAVMDGHGISCISERLIHKECREGQLWACNIEGVPMLRHFSVAMLRGKIQTEVMESFTEIIRDYAQRERESRHVDAHTHLVDFSR